MNQKLRIISLIPSATEIVYLLGLQDSLLACSHDSNYPKDALSKPKITDTDISPNLTSQEVDREVKKSLHRGRSLYHIDERLLKKINPNLVLTQELCGVCAPSFTQVRRAVKILDGEVKILSLEPESVDDMLQNILTIGRYTGRFSKARQIVARLRTQLHSIEEKVRRIRKKPKVVIIEWLEPIMITGHWVPEMVERAGGRMLLSKPRKKSHRASWREVLAANPDVLIFAPCGFDIKRTKKEMGVFTKKKGWLTLQSVKEGKVYLVDGDAYLTRSGPRLVDGVKILAKIFHPRVFEEPSPSEATQFHI